MGSKTMIEFSGTQEKVAALAKTFKAVVFDVDGVLFPNEVVMGMPDGWRPKTRSYYDGQGTSLLRAIGIRIAFVTNEKGDDARAIEQVVEKLNRLASSKSDSNPNGWEHVRLYTGRGGVKKLETANEWLAEIGVTLSETAAMGDDLVDLQLLRAVGFPTAPKQAEKIIRDLALFVSEREGGKGAIRDFANFVLEARGVDPASLPPQ